MPGDALRAPGVEGIGLIKRRHIIYVHGYDPQGPTGYYRMFARELKKFNATWSATSELGQLEIESDDFAHWRIVSRGQNWSVDTRYDFVRYDGALNENLSQPLWRQIPRALRWIADDYLSGTTWRTVRAAWRYWLHIGMLQFGLLAWLALAGAGGWIAGRVAAGYGAHPAVAIVAGAAAALAVLLALRPLAERWFIIRVNNCWPHMRAFGAGRPTCFDRPIEAAAARLTAAAAANDADEIVLVGHSGGGPLAPAILVRALTLDPDLGRRGPRIILLTIGSVMPGVALHPRAQKMRDIVRRVATEPSIIWIDCQTRRDTMNFWAFDPVAGIGVDAGNRRCGPLVWDVSFNDLLSPPYYRQIRLNIFRLHYQFIMSGDLRAPYDYLMLTCGPLSPVDWAAMTWEVVNTFAPDGRFNGLPASSMRERPRTMVLRNNSAFASR